MSTSRSGVGGSVVRNARVLVALCGAVLMSVIVGGCGGNGGSSTSGGKALWVTIYEGSTVAEFKKSLLAASGTPSPSLLNSGGELNEPWGIAFDKHGNLWVANFAVNTLTEYTSSQLRNLKKKPAPVAKVVISGANGPSGLAFDSSGNLWVAEWTGGDIIEYTPNQLTASGNPTPALTVSSGSFVAPSAIQFLSGNLWVANTDDNSVLEFTAAQVSAGGTQTPNLTLATSSIETDYGITFDKSGNLWVANYSSDTVQEFAASDLTGSGTITPAASVTLNSTTVATSGGSANSLDGPCGLVFDKSGNLLVANYGGSTLAKFTPSQIAADGSPVPNVFIGADNAGTSLNGPLLMTFGPSIP